MPMRLAVAALFVLSLDARAADLLFDDEAAWMEAAGSTACAFIMTPENVALADTLSEPPKPGVDLGQSLSFQSASTGLPFDFAFQNMSEAGTYVAVVDPDLLNSMPSADHSWLITFPGATIRALGIRFRPAANQSTHDYLVRDVNGGVLFDYSVAGSGVIEFRGFVTDSPIGSIEYIDTGTPGGSPLRGFLTLAPAWSFDGCALAGVSGEPLLSACGDLSPGSENSLELTRAKPAALAGLFVSLGSVPVPFKGGTLKAFPTAIPPIFLPLGGEGEVSLAYTWPAGVPSGAEVSFQFAIQDDAAVKGVALSNAVTGTTP